MTRQPMIVAVVGPKGGVGKTTISANLALALCRLGRRVAATDLDLGSSNLHFVFGIRDVPHTLDDFLMNKVASLADVVLDTGLPGLQLIAGGNVPGIASLPYQRKIKLLRHLRSLDCDYLLLDLAAGVSNNVIDFSLMARRSLLVTTPDIPSLMSLYSYVKSMAYRRLHLFFKQAGNAGLMDLLEASKDPDVRPDLKTLEDFYRQGASIDAELIRQGREVLARFDPVIVVNRVRTEADRNAGTVIGNLMARFLSLEGGRTLCVREDGAVGRATARMRPALLTEPDAPFVHDVMALAHFLETPVP
ncbi:P-loop NTPase [Solidesulfovibrio magneticus]|uniref:CobQ/CobB/MinD/ParA nucleotide binding domain-containing protein n=1 Tax=Solidesulfovibrio magneticus (strain ATCC 700980 / DSM 13731 / RS-1) TaxID=573370 RepID=C4XP72_SOLM1|nr:P-loop NTPase [Solidesulfovibrio magneticus]BAH77573.1 hypothetical protein DMR_40820 [Solidesulfovibrio magneticus RS-1]